MVFIVRGFRQSIPDSEYFDPWESQNWDFHRRIAGWYRELPVHLTTKEVSTRMRNFNKLYGDLFNSEEINSSFSRVGSEKSITDAAVVGSKFLVEWRDISRAIQLIDDGDGQVLLDAEVQEAMPFFSYNSTQVSNSLISIKLQQYTTVDFVKRLKTSSNRTMALRPTSLAGWVWALICRDVVENITYTKCSCFEICGRELPNLTPSGKMILHCSGTCQKRASRKKASSNL